jgi:hypothetical protein
VIGERSQKASYQVACRTSAFYAPAVRTRQSANGPFLAKGVTRPHAASGCYRFSIVVRPPSAARGSAEDGLVPVPTGRPGRTSGACFGIAARWIPGRARDDDVVVAAACVYF